MFQKQYFIIFFANHTLRPNHVVDPLGRLSVSTSIRIPAAAPHRPNRCHVIAADKSFDLRAGTEVVEQS